MLTLAGLIRLQMIMYLGYSLAVAEENSANTKKKTEEMGMTRQRKCEKVQTRKNKRHACAKITLACV
jgi:hypothetical protein